MEVGGFVLAGGRSSRMGVDKALMKLGGKTLVERAVLSLQGVCAEVWIAGGIAGLERYGRVVPDAALGCGPLGGIVAGLETTAYEWNAFLAVDVPFVPASVWRGLFALVEGSGAVAVLPRVGGFEQPLCGVYARRGASGLRRELEAGHLKLTAALDTIGPVHLMEVNEAEWFANLNTPEEFTEAERRFESDTLT